MSESEALRYLRGDDVEAAARAETELWEMWHRSGDREVDALFREGVAAMERGDFAGAEAIFARDRTRAGVRGGVEQTRDGPVPRGELRGLGRRLRGDAQAEAAPLRRALEHPFGTLPIHRPALPIDPKAERLRKVLVRDLAAGPKAP